MRFSEIFPFEVNMANLTIIRVSVCEVVLKLFAILLFRLSFFEWATREFETLSLIFGLLFMAAICSGLASGRFERKPPAPSGSFRATKNARTRLIKCGHLS